MTASAVTWRERDVPVEVPVALVYNGTTTRHDGIADRSRRFRDRLHLSEGIIGAEDVASLECSNNNGVELRMWLVEGRARDSWRAVARSPGDGAGCAASKSRRHRFDVCDGAIRVTFRCGDINTAWPRFPPADPQSTDSRRTCAGFWTAI